ncbi:carbohydrate-binding module family 18 protein, partial [Sporormia fimetaria CBS 119925]
MRGVLLWTLAVVDAVYARGVSRTGLCGAANGRLLCTGSSYGKCCSQYGWCGNSPGHCGTGCDPAYGSCTSSAPAQPQKVSNDGFCGGNKGYTCQGSVFGNCCSTHGYCGSTQAYCGTGCKPAFGTCSNDLPSIATTLQTSTPSAPVAAPSSDVRVSTNARCGNLYGATGGFTCMGSAFGDCCSEYSYCGSTSAYCGKGCQSAFGNC